MSNLTEFITRIPLDLHLLFATAFVECFMSIGSKVSKVFNQFQSDRKQTTQQNGHRVKDVITCLQKQKNPLLKGLSEPLWKMYEPETASYDENKCGVRQPLESRPLGKNELVVNTKWD